MRILYQFATAKHKSELGMAEVERRHAKLKSWVSAGVTVDVGLPDEGPGSIESRFEAAMSVPALLKRALTAEEEGYDALIVSCYSDPGLDAAREVTSIPVVGSGQASMHMAAQLGGRFTIIAPNDASGSKAYENPRKYGLAVNYASTRGSGLSVMDLAKDRERALDRIAEVGRAAVEEDGADTLILGCMSMAFHDITADLGERIGAPVINPVPATLAMAEYLARNGLCHSRRAYPTPPKLEYL